MGNAIDLEAARADLLAEASEGSRTPEQQALYREGCRWRELGEELRERGGWRDAKAAFAKADEFKKHAC